MGSLDVIRAIFACSEEELARLLGVSRPAVQQWRVNGIPALRAADVDRLRELAQLFRKKFIAVRIPVIVRTPGKGLGGKTVLQTIEKDGIAPVYAYLERLFSYQPS